jgi:hypothetical protein
MAWRDEIDAWLQRAAQFESRQESLLGNFKPYLEELEKVSSSLYKFKG